MKEELEKMESSGVIERVTQPTDWCAPMVPVIKPNGQICICVDLKRLNENIKRERFMLPTTDKILTKLTGVKVFTSLDAATGFWQIPLHTESSQITTFIMLFARYCFKRLPFGISIAPDIFQRKMQKLLYGLEGVQVYMDDVIIYGASIQEHDARLKRTMETMEFAGLRLNKDKCKIRQSELHFLGQVVDENGVRADPEKVKAIAELKAPMHVHEIKRVLGMINYMGKYKSQLYELLRTETAWTWDSA